MERAVRLRHTGLSGSCGAIVLFLLAVWATCAAASGQERVLRLSGTVPMETIRPHLDVLIDPTGTVNLEQVRGPLAGEFAPLADSTVSLRNTRNRTWLRLRVENATEDLTRWRLYAAENFKMELAIHVVRDGAPATTLYDVDWTDSFSARPLPHPEIVAPLRLAPGERATLFVRVWSEGASDLDFALMTVADFQALTVERMTRNAVFYGMMILLIAGAFVCLLLLRRLVFAAYCGYAGSALLYVMHVDGVAFQWLWPDYPRFNAMAASVLAAGIVGFGAVFARVFLRTRKHHPWLDRVLIVVGLAPLVLIAVLQPLDSQLLKRVLTVVVLVAIVMYTLAGMIAARRRFRQVRFYLFAWVSAVGSALVLNLDQTFGFDLSADFVLDTMRAVLVFDAAMMGLAIADRYSQLRQSQKAAMQANLDEAERNLQLGRRLNALELQYGDALRQARMRSERIRDTVHDLQQPLHALRLQIHGAPDRGPQTPGELTAIEGAFGYLERLIATALVEPAEAATEAAADEPPVSRPIELATVLQTLDTMFAADAAARGLTLEVVPTDRPFAIDGFACLRVLSNLVQNAVEYTAAGTVRIEAEPEGDNMRVVIADTGPGLSPTQFERAVKRGERLDEAADTPARGLGLAIVQALCDQHGYGLRVVPRDGPGTHVEVTLRRAAGSPDASPPECEQAKAQAFA